MAGSVDSLLSFFFFFGSSQRHTRGARPRRTRPPLAATSRTPRSSHPAAGARAGTGTAGVTKSQSTSASAPPDSACGRPASSRPPWPWRRWPSSPIRATKVRAGGQGGAITTPLINGLSEEAGAPRCCRSSTGNEGARKATREAASGPARPSPGSRHPAPAPGTHRARTPRARLPRRGRGPQTPPLSHVPPPPLPPPFQDWIDSPLTGQGLPPPAGVDVYLSFYLDRLIEIDEQRYRFSLNCMLYLSWKDERAGAAVEEATTAASAPGGSCGRPCNGQRVFAPGVSRCCDPPLWLPSIVFRNVEEFPQGRAQPYYIDVDPDAGTVTWRVEMRSSFLTTLDVSAFPFDTQSLDMVATLFNFPGQVSARCGGGGGGGGGGRGGGAVRGGIGGLPPILFSPFFFPSLFSPSKRASSGSSPPPPPWASTLLARATTSAAGTPPTPSFLCARP